MIVRYGGIGNTLASIPAVRALKKGRPGSSISMLVDRRGWEIFEGCPYIDQRILYEKDGENRGVWESLKLIGRLRGEHFTTSIHCKRFRRSEIIGVLAGAGERVGFDTPGRTPLFLTRRIPYVEGKNIVDLTCDLVRAVGVNADDLALEIWPTGDDKAAVEGFLRRGVPAGDRLIAVHPGGETLRSALWGARNFAALGAALQRRTGCRILLIGGPSEAGLHAAIAREMTPPPILSPPLSIRGTAELIRRCTLFVGMDSGPSHLADAVGTPGVILYQDGPGYAAQISKWKPAGGGYLPLPSSASADTVVTAAETLMSAPLPVTP